MSDDPVSAGWPYADDPAGYWVEWTPLVRRIADSWGVDPTLDGAELFEAVRAGADEEADRYDLGSDWSAVWLALVGCAEQLRDQWNADGAA